MAVFLVRWPVAEASHRRNDVSGGPTSGPSSGVATSLVHPEGLGVTLPCASAKRSRLLPEVFDGRSPAVRMLLPLERAIIREVNETVFADWRYCWFRV